MSNFSTPGLELRGFKDSRVLRESSGLKGFRGA